MAQGRDVSGKRSVLGSAPRAKAKVTQTETSPRDASTSGRTRGGAEALVETLVETFREQVNRALKVELDMSPTSLAFVDHYLRLAREEEREPILSLLAAGAGAYYGEIVRREIGAVWIGHGEDPRRLRLLVSPQFVHFSPVDQAFEAIVATAPDEDDPRLPAGAPLDGAFHLRPPRSGDTGDQEAEDDATWLEARLSELAPVPEDEFYALTCRFETLQLMLELLAAKHASEGRAPREYGVRDYLDVLASG